jgi:hypothetical protein
MAAVPHILEEVDGEMIPRLAGTPDGVRYFTPEQAARRKGRDAAHWSRVWQNTLGTYAALLDPERQPLFVDEDGGGGGEAGTPARADPAAADRGGGGGGGGDDARSPRHRVALDAVRRLWHGDANPSDEEWALFLELHRQRRLNPLARPLVLQRRYDARLRREVLDVITSYHVLNLVAARTGELAGEEPVRFCGPDREWVDVWTRPEPPYAARAAVYRKGCERPFYGLATWDFYAPYVTGDRGERLLPEYWEKDRGAFMLAKAAKALARREAFPEDLGGLLTVEEMAQARSAGERAARREAAAIDDAAGDDPDADAAAGRAAAHAWERDWDAVPETNRQLLLELIDLGVPAAKRDSAKATYFERHPRAEYESPRHLHRAILLDVKRAPAAYGVPDRADAA